MSRKYGGNKKVDWSHYDSWYDYYGNYDYDDEEYGSYGYGWKNKAAIGTGVTVQTAMTPKRTPEQEAALERIKKNLFSQKNCWMPALPNDSQEEEHKNIYFPARDGLYVKEHMNVGGNDISIISKAKECLLLSQAQEGIVDLNIREKIPAWLLKEVIGSFNLIYKDSGDEAAAQIYKRKSDGTYFIYYPVQNISKAAVSYPDDPMIQSLRDENELVCELHSHNNMSAFWSGTDDANEKEICFYVVLGTFGATSVTYKARVKCNAFQKDLHLYDLFDMTDEEEVEMLKKENISDGNPEIRNKVHKTPIAYKYSSTAYGNGATAAYGCGATALATAQTDPYYDRKGNTMLEMTDSNNKGKVYKLMEDGTLVEENTISSASSVRSEGEPREPNGTLVRYKDIEGSTINYIDMLAEDYNAANLDNSDTVRYLASSDIHEVKDDLGVIDSDNYTNAYNIVDTTNKDKVYKNIDARAHALLLKTYVTAVNYNIMEETDLYVHTYTPQGFVKSALEFNNTDAPTLSWSLITFWESLDKYQKSLIAYVFDHDILYVSQFMHEYEVTNYYFMDFLAHIVLSSTSRLNEYYDFIKDISFNFDTLMENVDENDRLYDELSEVECYLGACLDEHMNSNALIGIDTLIDNIENDALLTNEYQTLVGNGTEYEVVTNNKEVSDSSDVVKEITLF